MRRQAVDLADRRAVQRLEGGLIALARATPGHPVLLDCPLHIASSLRAYALDGVVG